MISVVVPSLNEEKNVAGAVSSILNAAQESGSLALDIILVNDGSSDNTAAICDELVTKYSCIRVIHHECNRGVAESVKEALKLAIYPKFISLPGSNDVGTKLLVELFHASREADFVLTYYTNQHQRTPLRRALSFLFSAIYRLTFQIKVRYVSGPAIYQTESLRRLRLRSNGFSIFPEMTLKTVLSGCRYIEIPGDMVQFHTKSTALSLKSFLEILSVYLMLVWEIKFCRR